MTHSNKILTTLLSCSVILSGLVFATPSFAGNGHHHNGGHGGGGHHHNGGGGHHPGPAPHGHHHNDNNLLIGLGVGALVGAAIVSSADHPRPAYRPNRPYNRGYNCKRVIYRTRCRYDSWYGEQVCRQVKRVRFVC